MAHPRDHPIVSTVTGRGSILKKSCSSSRLIVQFSTRKIGSYSGFPFTVEKIFGDALHIFSHTVAKSSHTDNLLFYSPNFRVSIMGFALHGFEFRHCRLKSIIEAITSSISILF